ncbi:hypothetical protein KTR66_09860 [Roseococcus sp. SDR]|uniref:hypothetical protein n=1 Tax=Roseococcus sp. SDR TaxID=2835532 RepID=UPI001BCE4666|nr:hypothetical protein [Roseococcus sp. SDR]MBS7790302.1 hypothetical protein [Roseococcus sp. SDR]MBV1845616.1 hypothetical protein [Roseococcus sp. SDR]
MDATYEITLQQTKAGWHWTVFRHDVNGATTTLADSFETSPTATIAAAEAAAEIATPGRALGLYRQKHAA